MKLRDKNSWPPPVTRSIAQNAASSEASSCLVEVSFVDPLGEESDHTDEVARVRAEAVECRGSEEESGHCGKALVVIGLNHLAL